MCVGGEGGGWQVSPSQRALRSDSRFRGLSGGRVGVVGQPKGPGECG